MPDPAGSPSPARALRRGPWTSILILIIVPFLFYAAMIVEGKEPPAPDTAACMPFSVWGAQLQHETGRIPDWYPYIMGGMPSYGSYIYTPRSPFNPVALVQRVWEGKRGAAYWFLLCVAGLALFAFLRRQGFSRGASTISALLFSMTPYMPGIVAAGHSTKLEALCLLPVFLLVLDLFLERPGIGWGAGLAGAMALLGWTNHPQVAFYGLTVGFLYALLVLLTERRAAGRDYWLRLVGFGLGAAILAVGMATEPFLAVREYAPWSIRGAGATGQGGAGVGWDYATAWSFHPRELISFLFPGWFGLQGATYWGPMPFTQSTHYFGVATLVLAVYGLARTRGTRRWIWGGISLLVLFIGFGSALPVVYGPMFHLIPYFNRFRLPSMIYSILPLCLAFPVAAGLDALIGAPAAGAPGSAAVRGRPGTGGKRRSPAPASGAAAGSRRLLLIGAALVVIWIILALGARAALGPTSFLRPEEMGHLDSGRLGALQAERLSVLQRSVAQAMIVLLLGVGILALRFRRGAAPWIGLLAGLLVVGDVVLVGRSFYHVEPKPTVRESIPLPGACDFLSRQEGTFRILPVSSSLFRSNAFGLARLESVGGYHTARLRAYQDLVDGGLISRPAALSLLNVRYLLSPSRIEALGAPLYEGDGFVYAWPESLPRAWAVRQVAPVADLAAFARQTESEAFRPGETALAYPGEGPSRADFASARVSLVGRGPGSLRLRVDADGDAFVVVSEMAFPPGWTAAVDGRPVRIHRVNHALMGLEVPAGSHEVALAMQAPARSRGMRISRIACILALVLGGVACARGRISRHRGASGQDAVPAPEAK